MCRNRLYTVLFDRKCTAILRCIFQSVKKQHSDSCTSCGSTHKIEFAEQIHKFREHGPDHPLLPLCGNSPCVSRNLYKGRKNVPVRARFFFGIRSKAWFRARDCSENVSFSTASKCTAILRCIFLQTPKKHWFSRSQYRIIGEYRGNIFIFHPFRI